MFESDQVTDCAEVRELRDSLLGSIPERPSLETITAKGRVIRRQRRVGLARLSTVGSIAVIGLVVVLNGVRHGAANTSAASRRRRTT